MAKTLSGAEARNGKTIRIGDNRYGLREEYDPEVKRETLEHYRTGHNLTVTEVKNPLTQTVKTVTKK
jgi:predicted small metal-binding protein